MLKCCGCQTNFILSLGGSFLFSKNFLPTPSLTGGLVMPIRRTIIKDSTSKEGRVFSSLHILSLMTYFYLHSHVSCYVPIKSCVGLVNNPDSNCTCNERNDDRYACTFYEFEARDVCDTSYGDHNSTDWAE